MDLPLNKIWQRLDLWILIAGSAFIIPFLFSYETADPFLTPRYLALVVLCSCLFFFIFIKTFLPSQRPTQDYYNDPVFLWLTLYLAFSLISLAKAVNLGEGVAQWLKSFLFFAVSYGSLLTLGTDPKRLQWLTRFIILSAIAFGAVGWIQWCFPDIMKIPGHFNVFCTMGNKNIYASALFLFLPYLLFGIFQYQGVWRHIAMVAFFMIGVGIAVTRTRSVWLAVVLSGMVTMLTTPGGRQIIPTIAAGGSFFRRSFSTGGSPDGRRTPTYGYGFLWMLVALVLAGGIITAMRPSITSGILATASIKDRMVLWQKTAAMVIDNPVLGVGPGQWKLRFPAYGRIDRQFQAEGSTYEVVFQRPHNDYLWVLAEAGLPGLICILFFYLILIRRCYGIIRHADEPEAKRLAACMLFGLIGFMVISFFSFPRERIFHNVFLGLMSAAILSTYHRVNGGCSKKTPKITRYRYGFILGLCAISLAVGYSRYRSDIHTHNALRARIAGQPRMVISQLDLAQTWLYTLDPASIPLAWYRAMAHVRLGDMERAQADFARACKAHPFHLHSLNNAAVCHDRAGNRAAAIHYRNRVEKLASSPLGQSFTCLDQRLGTYGK